MIISAEIRSLCDSFSLARREFYFDRSPRVFENILGLYRKGELHLTESVCPRDFLGELEYWGLSSLYLGKSKSLQMHSSFNLSFPRALLRLHPTKIILAPTHHRTRDWPRGSGLKINVYFYFITILLQVNPFAGMCCSKLRNVIWKLFEDPNSSTAAKVILQLPVVK